MTNLNIADAVRKAAKVSPSDILASESQPENEEKESQEETEVVSPDEVQEEEQPRSQNEETKDEADPSEEPSASIKTAPFHHHPRFKRLTEENKQLHEKLAQIEAWKEEVMSAKKADPKAESNQEVPAQLRHVFGDDFNAYMALESHLEQKAKTLAEQIYTQKIEQERQKKEQENQQTQELIQLYEDKLAELGEEIGEPLYDPKNSVRNEILKICEEKKIFTEDGYPNFSLANEYRLLSSKKKDATERKKVAANAGASSLGDKPSTDTSETVYTPSKLRKTSLANILQNK